MIEKFLRQQFSYNGKAVGFRADEVLLPNRKQAVREYLTHPGAVAIIPFLDSPKKIPFLHCRIALVEQFRYPVCKITEELPAGKVDHQESLLSCLGRELKEETGYDTSRFHHLASYWPTPAFSQEIIHIYWADQLKKGRSSPDEDEFLNVKIERFGNVLKKIKRGKIRDSKTVIGMLSFALFQTTLLKFSSPRS